MKLLVFFVLASLACIASSRPNGAPPEACVSLIPQHPGIFPQSSNAPFQLNRTDIPQAGYTALNSYRLTLYTDNIPFRGFIIQARTQPGNNLVGSFEPVDNKSRLLTCQLSNEDPISMDGTVTHSNPDDVTSVDLLWAAPEAGTGTIQFHYSVVANFSRYWVLIRSGQVFEETNRQDIEDLNYADCGVTRACYREPWQCRGIDCDYAVTWRVDEGSGVIEVEMMRNRRGWVAIGFSDDEAMGDDDVFVCQTDTDDTTVLIKDTYNPIPQYTANQGEADQTDIMQAEWSTNNNIIRCRFQRLLEGNSNTFDKDLSNGSYYIFFAFGDNFGDSLTSGVGKQHVAIPQSTTRARAVADVSEVEVKRPSSLMVKLHGGFMIFAWYFLAPVGIFLALFYKEAFPAGLWFYGHLAVMLTTIVFMLTGFSIILVYANGRWLQREGNQPHQIIGVIAIIAPCINVVLAFFRGDPDGNYRWLFNLVHGTNGFVLALVAAMFNIILGLFRLSNWIEVENLHFIRKSLYMSGATIGFTIMTFFFFNVYRLLYHKRVPRPQELGGGDDTSQLLKDDEPPPSPDYICRISLGIVIMVMLLGASITTIVLMALS